MYYLYTALTSLNALTLLALLILHSLGTLADSSVDKELLDIHQWLSAPDQSLPDPYLNYDKALKLRQAETGGWLLKSAEYTEWKKSAALPLWLYGIPGCGKTILCSAILQEVLEDCRDGAGRVACFFFDFNDKSKQNPGRMLRSLIWQFSWQSDPIPASLGNLFSSCQNGQQQPSADALQESLRFIIQKLPQAYIVLDALDECAQCAELMEMLQIIAGWELQNLHLLVTSRREPDIESTLEEIVDDQRRICLESALVDKDIQRYVQHRLATDKTLRRWRKDDIRQEIETILSSKANGMYASHPSFIQYHVNADDRFRWAACQLDSLTKCLNRAALRRALATLPPTLDQTYERILSAISEAHSEYAFRILRWLTYSVQPLSVNQIAEVVAIDTELDPAFDRDEVLEDPLDVLNICSSLITITRYNESSRSEVIVVLAHYSVQEYLVSDRIWKGKAAKYGMRDDVCHDAISRSCISYLLQLDQAELPPDFLQEFRLARYSAENWIVHARKINGKTEEIDQLLIRLFSKNNSSYINWIRLWNPNQPWKNPDLQKQTEGIGDPLYYAAHLGLPKVVKLLLDAGTDVSSKLHSRSALQAASSNGYELIVQLLIDAGADVNAQGSEFQDSSALQEASSKGHKRIVQLLLDAGANVNAHDKYHSSPLWAASDRGYEGIVESTLR